MRGKNLVGKMYEVAKCLSSVKMLEWCPRVFIYNFVGKTKPQKLTFFSRMF